MNRTIIDRPIYFLLFLLFIYLICFNQLDSFCLRNYDESRVAKSSYEMSRSGDFIVVRYWGDPDLWSTKPPLLNWIQALFIKLGGLGTLSVRLPSAIAGAILLLFLYHFFKKHYGDILLAYLVPVILGTTGAFIWYDHSFRSADYDGMLTLFLTIGCLLFFSYLHLTPEKTSAIYLAFLFFTGAVLTKGVAGFFLAPGLLLYTIISGKLPALLKDRHFYFGLLVFLLISAGYYYIRESRVPGYLKAVNDMELFGRYNNTFTSHDPRNSETWLNFTYLIKERFSSYYLLIPFSLALIPFIKQQLLRNTMLFSGLMSFSLLTILCLSKSKNYWYDLPALPFLSINAAILLMLLRNVFLDHLNLESYFKKNAGNAVILAFVFFFGFIPAFFYIEGPLETTNPGYSFEYVVQTYIRQHRMPKNSTYLAPLTQSQNFYFDMANEEGYNLKTGTIEDVKPGQVYVAAHKGMQELLESRFKFELLDEFREIKVYRILAAL